MADAAGLGGMMKSGPAVLETGESAAFTVLLWSQERQEVSLSAAAPPGFLVLVQPESLGVGPGVGSERVATGSGYASAVSARVLVRNEGAPPGDYSIPVYVRGSPGGGVLSFSPVVVLGANVAVPGERVASTTVVQGGEAAVYESYAPEKEDEAGGALLWVLLAASILAASFIIYRYA